MPRNCLPSLCHSQEPGKVTEKMKQDEFTKKDKQASFPGRFFMSMSKDVELTKREISEGQVRGWELGWFNSSQADGIHQRVQKGLSSKIAVLLANTCHQ